MRRPTARCIAAALMALPFAAGAQTPPRASAKVLMVQELPDVPGKEATVSALEYPPGSSSPPHRHNAHVFLHLLEGQLLVQVRGGQPVILNAGDTFYESPSDIHQVSKNLSATAPARARVFMVKEKGAPATTLVQE
jgi:quercetin dioxygenase-like cupin family protein